MCSRFVGEIIQGWTWEGVRKAGLGKGDIEQQCGCSRGFSPSSGTWRAGLLLHSCISASANHWLHAVLGWKVTLGSGEGHFLVAGGSSW